MKKSKSIAFWGVLGALAITVSALEGLFELPFLPPGAKPGLANVVTVAAAMISGATGALLITLIKSLFVFATRGATAFILSFTGGIIASLVTVLLLKMKKCLFSLTGISICGALAHNAGQLAAAAILTKTSAIAYYAPVLLIFSLISGFVTGIILKAVAPIILKINDSKSIKYDKEDEV